MKNIALIVAAGSGERYGSSIPKQYTDFILTKTIKKFLSSSAIDAIQVVIRQEDISYYEQAVKGLDLLPVCFGGKTRGDSTTKGLEAIMAYQPELVLVHDACRPFMSVDLINEVVKQLKKNPSCAIVPSLPINETIKKITPLGTEIISRDDVIAIQTPQGFYFEQLLAICKQEKHIFTDESSLAEAKQVTVIYITGEKENIKITYKEDIKMEKEVRTGSGFDAHKFAPEISSNNNIILGGVIIPFEKKLEAHSDGDVLIHALVDALLGSIGAGDIGMHFPPSQQKWKNADSKLFLIHANNLLKQKNGKINNIDITVICEKPRLGSYREQIRTNLAEILVIEEDRINIKATTTEKMGFTGRGEGIAVQAIATIVL